MDWRTTFRPCLGVLACLTPLHCGNGAGSGMASSGASSVQAMGMADGALDATRVSAVIDGSSQDTASQASEDAGEAQDTLASPIDEGATSDAMTPAGDEAEATAEIGPEGGDASSSGRDLSTDRAQFFGSSRCAQANVQLCDDFESGMLDKTTWTVEGTTPVIDGLQHARGNRALHITQPGNGLSYIKETKTFPEANDTYWGRIFVFFKSLPAPPLTYAHWTFIAASGTGVSGEIRVSGQFQNGANFFGVGTDNRVDDAGTGDWTSSDRDPPKAPVAVPLNQWICIEWLHKGDTNETRFFWDGVEHPSLYTSATMHGGNSNPFLLPHFTNVWIGWQEYQATTETFEMWIDEVAIDAARIGCVL